MKDTQWIIIGMLTAVSVSILTMLGNFLLWADFQGMEGLVPNMEATAPVLMVGILGAVAISITGYIGYRDTPVLGLTLFALVYVSSFAANWLDVGMGELDIVLYGTLIVIISQIVGYMMEKPKLLEMQI